MSRRTARINIQIDQPRSHNSSLLWWEHCRKAQVAIQLFNEYDNYFSHMPRLCKNTCSELRHQADDGPEPTALFAINTPSLLTFSLFIVCSSFAHCLLLFLRKKTKKINSSRTLLGEPRLPVPSPSTNPHPDPIRLIMVILSRGKCHYGNRGRGSGGLSVGKERGVRRRRRKR